MNMESTDKNPNTVSPTLTVTIKGDALKAIHDIANINGFSTREALMQCISVNQYILELKQQGYTVLSFSPNEELYEIRYQ
jgi:hypothetical protein